MKVRATKEDIERYIRGNLEKNLSIKSMCRRFGYAKYGFISRFYSLFGVAPHRYVMTQRVERAKQMLREGKTSSFICTRVGFCDRSHFARVFRRYAGVLPSEYKLSNT